MQRELALHFGGRPILEFEQLALVGGGRKLRCIQHSGIATLHVGFEFFEAEVDRVHIDDDVDGAALRFPVDDYSPVACAQLAAPHGHAAEMIRFEAWMSV